MQLTVKEVQLPQAIEFNYEELKGELEASIKHYATLVYTDDQIKTAKADRASLNKLKKALNDERIRLEKEYMQPFNEFKAKINELIQIIDKPVCMIDTQIKEYENGKQEEKQKEIEKLFEAIETPEWLDFPRIYDFGWLKASVTLSAIEKDMKDRIETIKSNYAELEKFPYFSFEACKHFRENLDFQEAVAVARRLKETEEEKKKLEEEKAKAEAKQRAEELTKATAEALTPAAQETAPAHEEQVKREWINFSAYLSVPEARALASFMNERHIEFKPL